MWGIRKDGVPASHSFQGAVEKVVRRASQKEAHAPGLAFYMTCREAALGPAQWACRASATHRWPFDEMARRGRERGLVKGGVSTWNASIVAANANANAQRGVHLAANQSLTEATKLISLTDRQSR